MNGDTTETISAFQLTLGYAFRDIELLARALTHKSFSNEIREVRPLNNERLEFLGDAILGFVVGEMIFRAFPGLQEGALSKIKAHLVSANMLGAKGRALGIGRHLRMGAGEARSGGAEKLSLLADGFEAVVAAIYLDGGLAPTEAFVRRVFDPEVSGIDLGDLSFHDRAVVPLTIAIHVQPAVMKISVILGHPTLGSFNHAIVSTAGEVLRANLHEVRVRFLSCERSLRLV